MEREFVLFLYKFYFLKLARVTIGTAAKLFKPEEGCGNNRSVMPLDVPGCTRATMIIAVSFL